MDQLLHLLSRYGYLILFLNLFLESVGLPIPAIPVLVAAGAASALGTMNLPLVFTIALLAMILGDWLLFLAGRHTGWALLGFLCRISASPETCMLKSAESFYRRGRLTLVFSKFIPGINTMAPPLAGSLHMSLSQFLALDLLGAALYSTPFIGLGFFFSHLVSKIVDGLHSLNRGLGWLAVLALVAFLIYRLRNYWKNRFYRTVPRITVEALSEKLASTENAANIQVADTRSHGYYDAGATRIKGSIRIEPNNLLSEMEKLSKEKEIYLYCT